MALLALDLGTKTGWAVRHEETTKSGTHKFEKLSDQRFGFRFLNFRRWLTETKNLYGGLEAVYFEQVYRHIGTGAAHCYGGFIATLGAWCEHHDVPYYGVGVGTLKKFATGDGHAKKKIMIEAMREKGFKPKDDNEADALAILLWALSKR